MDLRRPDVCQRFLSSSYEGSEGRVAGVDFIGTYGSSNSAYAITSFILNARNATVFPRLSAIASVFRRYFFRKIRFHLYGIQASTQNGYAAMTSFVTDDLSTVAAPTTEAQILNGESVSVCRAWSYTTHDVDLAGQGLRWYSTDTTASSTEFGEACGEAYLAVSQTTAVNDIRIQLYVEYEVELCMRIAASQLTVENAFGGRITGGGTLSTSNLLGDAAILDSQSSGLTVNSAGVVTINYTGEVLMMVDFGGTSSVGPTTPAGWTQLQNTNASGGSTSTFAKSVTAGETVGPLQASAASVTSSDVIFAVAPTGSVGVGYSRFVLHPKRMIRPH